MAAQIDPRYEEAAARQAAALAAAQAALQKAEREMVAAREAAQREEQLYAAREAQGRAVHPEEFRITITDPYERHEHDFTTIEHTMHQPEVVNPTPLPPRPHTPLHPNPMPTDRGAMPLPEVPPVHTHVVPEYPVYHPAAQAPPPGQAAYQRQPEYQQPQQEYRPQPPVQQAPPPVQRPQQQPYAGYRPEQAQQQAPPPQRQPQSYPEPMDTGYENYVPVPVRAVQPKPAPVIDYGQQMAPLTARPAWFYAASATRLWM